MVFPSRATCGQSSALAEEPFAAAAVSRRVSGNMMFAMQWPQHVVRSWIEHNVAVSLKHYVQTPDSLYEATVGLPVLRAAVMRRNDGNRSQIDEIDERRKYRPVNEQKSHKPFGATGFREMGGAGIEPATPGFSILCSTN